MRRYQEREPMVFRESWMRMSEGNMGTEATTTGALVIVVIVVAATVR